VYLKDSSLNDVSEVAMRTYKGNELPEATAPRRRRAIIGRQ